jgi:LacI family transcriptional regulator
MLALTQPPSKGLSVHSVPTLREVAERAGVSVGTASKALNGRGQLRAATRTRVLEAANALGFYPNELARSLHRKQTFTIGLISTDRYGRFSIPLLEGIEAVLREAKTSVFLCNAGDDLSLERQHIEALLTKRVDGIIVTSRRTDPRPPIDLGRSRIPIVYAYAQTEPIEAPCLLPDDYQGGRLAAEHLVALGRQKLAHVSGPSRFLAARLRAEATSEVLKEAGLRPPCMLFGAWSEAWGHEAVERIVSTGLAIDAIFCGSDQIARGTADALRERGIKVPDDVALVGYDNWEIIAAATRPGLTTIDMNLNSLGRQAGLCLLDLIAGKKRTEIEYLPCRLVVRESCGSIANPAPSAQAPARN